MADLSTEQQRDLVELLFDEAQALRVWAQNRAATVQDRIALRAELTSRARDLERRASAYRDQMQINAEQGGTT